ncbi:hypothetical protein EL84_02680 [Paenibacillus sp. VT-400]|uniref:metallophosphoesterase family protein n=1 Tax=Paenibacillus sp. VT-400 TaxID=1495853 RepID=UPI0006494123|nr:metallophosphoesterase family protein [Paenibacillus sp. VT-400]KLU57438.1 hypothetical protein EL84_02680 [Paenibacillus sp. VT-400]
MIAIISDIHGNYPALSAVLKEIDLLGCKQIISLGDIAGYYCMVNECIEALKNRNIIHLMGNHDYYLVNNITSGRSKTADRCILYQKKILTSENYSWLSDSKNLHEINDVCFVHGGWNDYLEEYLYSVSEEYFRKLRWNYFFSGHSHVQFKVQLGNKLYCNPGSIGQPRDGDPRAAYALLREDKSIELRRVEYAIKDVAYEMERSGFESYFYSNLYTGEKIGGGISSIKVNGGEL